MKTEQHVEVLTTTTHDSLRQAVKNALDKKRKLGQYSVQWRNNKILFDGKDLPSSEQSS
jgi:hypothetical protein